MKSFAMSFSSMILLILFVTPLQRLVNATGNIKSYVVYLGNSNLPADEAQHEAHHQHTVNTHRQLISSSLKRNTNAEDTMIYSYTKAFNGFAANLHEEEAKDLANHPDVITVFENGLHKLSTINSWKFLGMENPDYSIKEHSLWKKSNYGEDIIIGVLDSGTWPEAKSFSDEGYGPVPSRFKGICENKDDPTYKCNKKLIGSRYFKKGIMDVVSDEELKSYNETMRHNLWNIRDVDGHGSHCGSIATGNILVAADPAGVANGTAKGGAPRARLASYKACHAFYDEQNYIASRCSDADVLAAVDAAVHDGVDVISMSLSFDDNKKTSDKKQIFLDVTSISAFHAVVQKGIPVIIAAGNDGPLPSTVSNADPWVFTVAATTTDRQIYQTFITLGNNATMIANMITCPPMHTNQMFPLITGKDAAIVGPNANVTAAAYCSRKESVDPKKVEGKILVCNRGDGSFVEKSETAVETGAVGMIIMNVLPEIEYEKQGLLPYFAQVPISVPGGLINSTDALALKDYMKHTRSPVASLNTETGKLPAPMMANFSSRGPALFMEDILKPDISAPGVDIIAATTKSPLNPQAFDFMILSGTSQATPHVSGVVAVLKKVHHLWSPAAIKSAIMTTASIVDNRNKPILDHDMEEATPFAYGAGLIQPNSAMHPGLVHDMGEKDYLYYLCARGYDPTKMSKFTDKPNEPFRCPTPGPDLNIANLNYPTITIINFNGKAKVTRRLKNVNTPSTYTAKVTAPKGVTITVNPKTLTYTKVHQELEFRVTFEAKPNDLHLLKNYAFGHLVWSDGKHNVRSIITIKSI